MKNKILPIYHELQGYLSQAPTEGNIDNAPVWEQVNQTIDELNEITSKDYNRYKIKTKTIQWNRTMKTLVDSQVYRSSLSGLISRLYGEYFSDESRPFDGSPTTIINQTQQQNQSIQLILDIQSKIDKELLKVDEGSKEKSFLEKIKSSLSSIGSGAELITLIMKTANQLGITTEQLYNFFK